MRNKIIFMSLLTALFCTFSAQAAVHNVRKYGAKGNGVAIDSPAINKAIKAAAEEGGGTVFLPAGVYNCYSIHLASNITLELERGAVLKAAAGKGFDAAEPGPEPQYQDFGHSHFRNSLIWGENLDGVTICGDGMIDGTNLSAGYGDTAVENGVANKAIALKECRNITIRDITMYRCGHFALLATGVDNMLLDGITCDTNRDGFDVDCCRNVRISNCNVNSPHDDGIVLKASYALGRYIDTKNVAITNCHLSGYACGSMLDCTYKTPSSVNVHTGKDQHARGAGRIKLGTESSGGFQNIAVSNCTFEFCGGLFIESMDGGLVEDIVASNLTMRDCVDAPIFIRLGRRMRSPEGREVGKIRRVLISDVNVWNNDSYYPASITGVPGHRIDQLTLRNIHLNYEGGLTKAMAAKEMAEVETAYPDPWMFTDTNTPLPFSGLYLRHIENITIDGLHFSFGKRDERPTFSHEDVHHLNVRDMTLEGHPLQK